jgi:hypothetical protein
MMTTRPRTTRLLISRGTGPHVERTAIMTFGCPMFMDPKNDPQVQAALAAGWRITGHIDA